MSIGVVNSILGMVYGCGQYLPVGGALVPEGSLKMLEPLYVPIAVYGLRCFTRTRLFTAFFF